MPPEAADQADRAVEITLPVVASSPWSVRQVRALPGLRLAIIFADGTEGIADLSAMVESASAGVFEALRDRKLFEQAYVLYGAVTWPGDLDLAPDAMYDEIKAHGQWRIPADS